MRVSGTWEGEYTYGTVYGADGGVSVPFRMSLSEGWFGRFAGYVRDDASKGGMPERGNIAGRRKRSRMTFVKSMPNMYLVYKGGLVDLREWIEREHGLTVSRELPPHRIRYSGTFSSDDLSLTGTWAIVRYRAVIDEGVIEFGVGNGTWTARQVSDQASTV
jgi:hypothetical protein